jgi:hypothetical protein
VALAAADPVAAPAAVPVVVRGLVCRVAGSAAWAGSAALAVSAPRAVWPAEVRALASVVRVADQVERAVPVSLAKVAVLGRPADCPGRGAQAVCPVPVRGRFQGDASAAVPAGGLVVARAAGPAAGLEAAVAVVAVGARVAAPECGVAVWCPCFCPRFCPCRSRPTRRQPRHQARRTRRVHPQLLRARLPGWRQAHRWFGRRSANAGAGIELVSQRASQVHRYGRQGWLTVSW